MKFIKSLVYNCLYINNLNKLHYNNLNKLHYYNNYNNNHKLNTQNIIKYNSIKKIKKYYFDNNLYFDIYRETPSLYNKNLLNENKKLISYNKYTDLTAEHIFPQSFLKNYPNAKFDMHNIFLTLKQINCNRSNYKYTDENKNNIFYYRENTDINSTIISYNPNINYKNNKLKLFIPYSNSRGKISRAIAYMKIKYQDIILENAIDLDILLYWNYLYPPTNIEIIQNKKIKDIQGNYNHFINEPKLMEKYFL